MQESRKWLIKKAERHLSLARRNIGQAWKEVKNGELVLSN